MKRNNWLNLNQKEQIELFNHLSIVTGLPAIAIEKDAWVTMALRMIFNSELKDKIVFKGGTSLSKCNNLINRLSEDIDFSIDREFLGFSGDLTKGEIRKLRKASHSFILSELPILLEKEFENYGIDNKHFKIEVPNTKITDQDPETVFINYKSVFEESDYLLPRVQIEISARSILEPYEEKEINSIIDSNITSREFTESKFKVNAVVPTKTFIEKLILLHEEFQKPTDKIRTHRMSRHLYDIVQIMGTDYYEAAIKDKTLLRDICMHREKFTPLKPIGTINYSKLTFENLEIIPPKEIIEDFRKDYTEMKTTMFYGDSASFDEVISKLKLITKR